jgi:5-formyltetrahydrofolate cyclo-ligase
VVTGRGQRLLFRAWAPGEPLVRGVWDIPTPHPEAELVEPDAVLVPMLAFDRLGFRLGYGGGYYDRTLRELRSQKKVVAIGVAYSAQEVSSVPHDENDARLDYLLTERGYQPCA